jgi:hypothetical protein
MKKYRHSILALAILISPLAALFIYIGINKGSITHLLFWGGVLIVSWGLYLYLLKGSCLSFWLSFALVNIVWWPLLLQTIRRVIFLIVNQGMDRADGGGSPLAFFLGLVGEQIFFIPLTFAMIFGVPMARALGKRGTASDSAN